MTLAGENLVHVANLIQTKKQNRTELFIKGKSEISCGVPLIAPISDAACAQRYPHSINIEHTYDTWRKQYTLHITSTNATKIIGKFFIMAEQQLGDKSEISCGKCCSLHQNMCCVCTKISSFKS